MKLISEPETLDFLLAQICHLHHSRAHQHFEAVGLYRGQPPVLHALWEKEGLTHSELASKLKITRATMTKMLQRMEKTGFLVSKPDPIDQRVSRVFLTEAGKEVKTRLEDVWRAMDNETFAGFSLEERSLLRQLLLQVLRNLLSASGEVVI